MKRVLIGVAVASASILAHADGPPSQYEQSIINQRSLDPNEAIVNDDGASEDPNHPMTPTARAFRNGYYSGKSAQREQQAQVNVPPLPSDQDWAPPQRIQPQYLPKPVVIPHPARAPVVLASVPGAYASVDEDGPHVYVQRSRAVPNVVVVDDDPPPVYVQAPPQYYAPPPPVYVQPPVYVRPGYYPPQYAVQPQWGPSIMMRWH